MLNTIYSFILAACFASTAYATTAVTTVQWAGTVPPVDAPADQWKVISYGPVDLENGIITFIEKDGIFDVNLSTSNTSRLKFNVVNTDDGEEVTQYDYELTRFTINGNEASDANFWLADGNGTDLGNGDKPVNVSGPTSLLLGGEDVDVVPESTVTIVAEILVSSVNL